MAAAPVSGEAAAFDPADVQALVVTGWKRLEHAALLVVTFDAHKDASAVAARRRWLAGVVAEVATAADVPVGEDDPPPAEPAGPGGTGGRAARRLAPRVQIALSAAGLAAIGASPDELAGLADECKQGMSARARLLGDGDTTGWELGGARAVSALLLCYAPDAATLAAQIADHEARARAAGATVGVELTRSTGALEHFGFADGISQPWIPGMRPADPGDRVATGELLLGYPNGYGRIGKGPHATTRRGRLDLGRNGTYLVVRKLEQHVERFWGYFAAQAAELRGRGHGPGPDASADEVDAWIDWLAAKTVGRWRSGAPLVLAPERDDPALADPAVRNQFEYAALDLHGERCPLGSHIRRANPRDARGAGDTPAQSRMVVSRHRILRRGRSWGPPMDRGVALRGASDGGRRGLWFLCLQASIARGFEFVQQTWLANLGFARLCREGDPVAGGDPDPGGDPHDGFTIPARPARLRLRGRPQVVTTLGGEYCFMPSMTALRYWARAAP